MNRNALVYGQMNEPPGARARVGLTGLTVAEYFETLRGRMYCFCRQYFPFHASELKYPTSQNPFGSWLSADPSHDLADYKKKYDNHEGPYFIQAIYVPADDHHPAPQQHLPT